MSIINFMDHKQKILDRSDQYRAGEISESVFRASLIAMGLRKSDLGEQVHAGAPTLVFDHEQSRYEASVEWLRDFLAKTE